MKIHTRQISLIGPKNQQKIKDSVVAIIGLGALGSASAHLLARIGVGKLILCDGDTVADHNLSRQHLYTVDDIDKKKVEAAKAFLQKLNPDLLVDIFPDFITQDNISICSQADIIIDGVDNHATRRIIDSFCKQEGLPWIHGAAIEDKGTVVFFPPEISYEAIYEGKTNDQHCSISGVIVTATTLVATLQASLFVDHVLEKEIPRQIYHISGSSVSTIDF